MWVQETSSGKYQFCERYKDPNTGETKKTSIVMKDDTKLTRARAVFELQKKINLICFGDPKGKALEFGNLCDRYVAYHEKNNKEQTAVNTERHLVMIRRLIGDKTPVEDLTPSLIKETLNTGAPSLFNGRMKFMRSMLRWAYEEELIEDCSCVNRVKNLKDHRRKEKLQAKFLEKAELKEVLDAMTQEQWRLLTMFLALTGMRIGEAMALRRSDVDEERRTISIERTYSLTIQKATSVKTDASYREIHMQPELVECYRQIVNYHRGIPGNLVFRSKDGVIAYPAYRKYLKENVLKVTGKELSPHALRHTHVALLAEAGMSLEAISKRLGHADSRITKDVYYHVTNTVKERENRQLDGIELL